MHHGRHVTDAGALAPPEVGEARGRVLRRLPIEGCRSKPQCRAYFRAYARGVDVGAEARVPAGRSDQVESSPQKAIAIAPSIRKAYPYSGNELALQDWTDVQPPVQYCHARAQARPLPWLLVGSTEVP